MHNTFDFFGGMFLGTFLGSLVTLVYHVRQLRHEARQNYLRLSLAQSEVVTLERTLEIHRRNSTPDFTPPAHSSVVHESEAPDALPLLPPWMGNSTDPATITSERTVSPAGET